MRTVCSNIVMCVGLRNFSGMPSKNPAPIILRELHLKSHLKTFSTHKKMKVFLERGTKCVQCERVGTRLIQSLVQGRHKSWGIYTQDLHQITIDHKIPKSRGGTDAKNNLQPMCYECNQAKADKVI
jgi:5-methylcytosine-specific restriction endonuclease McrA